MRPWVSKGSKTIIDILFRRGYSTITKLEATLIPAEVRGQGGPEVYLFNVRTSLPAKWPEDDDSTMQGAL